MTRRIIARIIGAALVLSATSAAFAKADSVPASFDCAKAGSTVEKVICAQAALRWQDLALSRSYRAARDAVTGAARDDLLASQRDWVRERDRRCIADRTFAELADTAAELGKQAYDCLNVVYLDRRRQLQDLAAAPLVPRAIQKIDLTPIVTARPDIAEDGAVRVSDIRLSPDGALAAILLPSLELDGPDQIWLYRIADRRLVAATPSPDRQQPHPDGAPMAIKSLAWRGATLYARVAIWSKANEGEHAATAVYAATTDASRRLDNVPGDVAALLDSAEQPGTAEADEVADDDQDGVGAVHGNHRFLVWIHDRGHGTIELNMRKRIAGSQPFLVAWGSWELSRFLFDAERSRLVHAADTGIAVLDMASGGERRVAGTSRGDQPRAIAADSGVLLWSTRNHCGDEFMTEQDDSQPEHFCLARLTPPEAGK
jgi:uncharacterized protein